MLRGPRRSRTLVLLGGLFALTAVVIAIFASVALYRLTIDLLTENLRQRLLSISVTAAANIDADKLAALQSENDWTKPEWRDVVTHLKRTKDLNKNIVFMYIFRKTAADPTQMEFVADAESINPYANLDQDPSNDIDANHDGLIEPEGADKLQWPGQPYPEAIDIPETFQAYQGPLTAQDLYTDSYGQVLTGYAPIADGDGNVVAILATDIKADDFFTVTRQTLVPFLIFITVLILIISSLSITLIYIKKRQEEQLQTVNEEVYKHSLELVRLKQALEVANAQQENLLHFISHEIKGYLTKSEAGFAAIAEGDYGVISEQLKGMATSALLDVRKGVRTVMQILDASNMKKGTMGYKKEPFDMKKIVIEAVNHLKPAAEEKSISIDLSIAEGEYALVGDEEKIKQHVLRNLVDNAIKYTPRGAIGVELSREGKTVRFAVKDNGIGITPEDMARLFTEGGHGKDSIKVNVHSTGYGLFIAKQVVVAHGGKIWAESEGAGKGSRFVVELPSTLS